jgi:integrase/recombinase XerD
MPTAKILSERDIKLLTNHCANRRHTLRDRTIIHCSYLAGLRVCEIAALTVEDVFEASGVPRSTFVLRAHQTKGSNARVVYVSQKLARYLRDYWSIAAHHQPTAPLFQTQLRGAFSANTMCQLFLNIYAECNLKQCSSHSGRRTFITRLADSGVAVHVLAALAGHKHIAITQRYITVNDAMLARAVELL